MRVRLHQGERRVLWVDDVVIDDDGGPVDEEVQVDRGVLSAPLIDLQGDVAGAAAAEAGFGLVLPRAGVSRPGAGRVGALTVDRAGSDIADHGLLRDAGALCLSDGDAAHDDLEVLLGAARWAASVGLPILARPGVGALERGMVRAGPEAVRRGLPQVFAESEALGVHRWATIARMSGARVHLLPLWSALGVKAVMAEQDAGAPISAGTTPHHLTLEAPLDEGRHAWRCWPVLGDVADRQALLEAIEQGRVTTLSTGSRAVASHQVQTPLVDQVPRAPSPQQAVGRAVELLGAARVAQLFHEGPRQLLGLPEMPHGLVWLDHTPGVAPGLSLGSPIPHGIRRTWGQLTA